MGTIASVLQWTCTNCNLINPTECLKCINCGNIRRIRVDRVTDYDSNDTVDSVDTIKHSNGFDQKTNHKHDDNSPCDDKNTNDNINCDGQTIITNSVQNKTTNTNKSIFHETLPGYVEINSNGYFLHFISNISIKKITNKKK